MGKAECREPKAESWADGMAVRGEILADRKGRVENWVEAAR